MSDYKSMTKEELMRLMAEKDKEISGKQEEIEVLGQEIKEINAQGAGWLIETPNPLFDGRTMGVQFVQGQAFIPVGMTVRSTVVDPMKESTLETYPEKQREAIRDRENVPSSERAAMYLETDYGYKVTFFDGSDGADKAMEGLVNERTKEYTIAFQAAEAREKAMNSMGAVKFGGN